MTESVQGVTEDIVAKSTRPYNWKKPRKPSHLELVLDSIQASFNDEMVKMPFFKAYVKKHHPEVAEKSLIYLHTKLLSRVGKRKGKGLQEASSPRISIRDDEHRLIEALCESTGVWKVYMMQYIVRYFAHQIVSRQVDIGDFLEKAYDQSEQEFKMALGMLERINLKEDPRLDFAKIGAIPRI